MDEENSTLLYLKEKLNLPIVIILLAIFLSLLIFYYLKADEITRDPCSICSERMGEEIRCTTGTSITVIRTFYPNGSIVDDVQGALDNAQGSFLSGYKFT